MTNAVAPYLDLLDSQREAAFAALEGLTAAQLWQKSVSGEITTQLGTPVKENF